MWFWIYLVIGLAGVLMGISGAYCRRHRMWLALLAVAISYLGAVGWVYTLGEGREGVLVTLVMSFVVAFGVSDVKIRPKEPARPT